MNGSVSVAERLSSWDFFYALDMALACLISYAISTYALSRFVGKPDDFLAGMWATVATMFVFRPTRLEALSAGISRLIATGVSFALCLAYFLVLPFHPVGLATLLGLGTLIMTSLGRQDDIVTTGITTAVVMVAAAMGPPHDAWRQPLLRVVDTVIGIAAGVACKWVASSLYWRLSGQPAR
jgi:uncharacterized membrane protein YccC